MQAVTIDRLAFGGAGVGRIDGKACFVPYTAPGDVAEIELTRNKRSYAEGALTNLITPSLSRVRSVCPVFGRCGGCHWQHIDYGEQCRQKEQIFADTLWRAARLDAGKIKPILRAEAPFSYRQRIQLHVNFIAGKLGVGFYFPGSHRVVDIPDCCPIAVPAINAAIAGVRNLILRTGEPEGVARVDLVASPDDQVAAIFYYIGKNRQKFARSLAVGAQGISSICIRNDRKSSLQQLSGQELMAYSLPSCTGKNLQVHYAPDGFSQVNFPGNRTLVKTLIEFCAPINPDSILDLFCGNGNFSLPLAGNARRVVGIESFAKSVQLAGYNAEQNGIDCARYRCGDSVAGLEQLAAAGEFFDLVVIDPPRAGAADVVQKIYRTKASHVIYISCDPPTLARDIAALQKCGYQVIHVQPVDLFPQTYHLESIAFLQALH